MKINESQCISRSTDWAEGGSEPMKINSLIGYIIIGLNQNGGCRGRVVRGSF